VDLPETDEKMKWDGDAMAISQSAETKFQACEAWRCAGVV
jgi:hypothetical protein